MVIGGLQKFSTLDYSGCLSAIVFTQGCNFRCHFCYNPMLVLPLQEVEAEYRKSHSLIPEDDFFAFLKSRQGKLDAVVVTGGEPTIHHDLPEFIKKIKDLGFKVKLDTNGTNPQVVQNLLDLKLIDYIAMDLKASPEKYNQAVGVEVEFSKVQESVKIIMNSKLPYEFRTTVVPSLISKEDIPAMGEVIKGADKWFWQAFQNNHDLVNKDFQKIKAYTSIDLEEMATIARQYVKESTVR